MHNTEHYVTKCKEKICKAIYYELHIVVTKDTKWDLDK